MTKKPATKPAKKRGAPTIKTQKLVDDLCAGIALGKSARAMCTELKISQRVLWNWLTKDDELMQQYARAKELCAETYAEDIIEISDDSGFDWKYGKDNEIIVDGDAIQRARLRCDSRKWYASKLNPKKYGDKITNEHQGGDPERPLNIRVTFGRKDPN